MLAWIRRMRGWRRDHERAWAPARKLRPDGQSSFQDDCLATLASACAQTGKAPPQVVRVPGTEVHFTGRLADGRSFYIYVDGAEVGARHFEEWDFLTPAELCGAFSAEIVKPRSK